MKGLGTQDCAIQESMGPIADRALEHLLVSDTAIVKIRRLLLQTLKDHAAGKPLPGMKPASFRVRSARCELPRALRSARPLQRVRATYPSRPSSREMQATLSGRPRERGDPYSAARQMHGVWCRACPGQGTARRAVPPIRVVPLIKPWQRRSWNDPGRSASLRSASCCTAPGTQTAAGCHC